ncbi:MAG: GAF domain-containing sensor histidine kinase [Trueperaceae bacterium]|nr:MAG: GAF domain-containing sensor histidine kinase [Trueperaceae bacterium]
MWRERRVVGSPMRQGSLYQQVKIARFWLPLTIVGVVVFHQLVLVPLGGDTWRFWVQLLFYSILGPAATFVTLNWIVVEVRLREEAQQELSHLYTELQDSHELLGAIQRVTEKLAAATDLETALKEASRDIAGVTGAEGVAILLAPTSLGVTRSYGLTPELTSHATSLSRAVLAGEELPEEMELKSSQYWVLTQPLTLAGKIDGSVHAYFSKKPTSKQHESFSILVTELAASAEAARSRMRDLLTLVAVDRSIRAEGNLERLLETLLSHMMVRTGASVGSVYLENEEHHLQLQTCLGLQQPINNSPIRLGEGLIGQVAEDGGARIVQYPDALDRSLGGRLLENANSVVALPLMVESDLLGVVVLAHEEPEHFEAAALPFLELLAGQVSLAVRNARAYLQSEELAIAEERARIAREIHDGVAQTLALSALKLDLVGKLLDRDPDKAIKELANTKTTIREMIKEVRRSIFALRPIDLERHGFVEALRRYCNDFGQQNDLQVRLSIDKPPNLTVKSEATLFRIFQEAMNNVAKHAKARAVSVLVGLDQSGQVYINVKDDGCGFDIAKVSDRVTSAGGLGLKQMRERLERSGGHFEIDSTPGKGTQLYASIPV